MTCFCILLQLRKNPMYENSFANILHFLENRKSLLRFLLKRQHFIHYYMKRGNKISHFLVPLHP